VSRCNWSRCCTYGALGSGYEGQVGEDLGILDIKRIGLLVSRDRNKGTVHGGVTLYRSGGFSCFIISSTFFILGFEIFSLHRSCHDSSKTLNNRDM